MPGPIALQAELDAIQRRRAIAGALRAREQMGEWGGVREGLSALKRAVAGDPLDELDRRESQLLKDFEDRQAKSYQGLLEMADPAARTPDGPAMGPPTEQGQMSQPERDFTLQEEAQRASSAMQSGVPQALIDKALSRRQGLRDLNFWTGQGGGSGGGGAAGASQPSGGSGVFPFLDGGQQGQGASGGQGAGPAAAMPSGGGSRTPLGQMPDIKLVSMLATLDPASVGGKLAAQEMKDRNVEVGREGILIRAGKPFAQIKDGIITDFATGKVTDLTGEAVAARAGKTKAAEAAATFPYETTQTVDENDRPVTAFKNQLPGAPGAAPVAPGGRKISVNFTGTAPEVEAYVKSVIADQAAAPARIGTGMAPLERKRKEADIETAANTQRAMQGGLAKIESDVLGKGRDDAQAAVTVGIPQIHEARKLLDSGNVNTGMGANVAQQFGRGLRLAHLSDGDGVAATQTFMAQAGKRVMGVIKQLGSGSGISDADREYAAKAVGGDITLDEKSIRRILDIDERAKRAMIAAHAKNVQRAAPGFASPEQRAFFEVEAPPAYAPPKRAARGVPAQQNVDALLDKWAPVSMPQSGMP